MRTLEKVKGAPVFFEKTRKPVGKITDLVLSHKTNMVEGYWVNDHRWWSKRHFLPLDKVVHEDADGMYVKQDTSLKTVVSFTQRFADGSGHSFGKPVKERDGAMIGILEDVYFLPDSGKIIGYELSEGLYSDIKYGVKVIKPSSPLVETESSLIVLN
ncbi:PRC-barrel domain-containing protein [Evansella tamaricis]|uniref:PRC-barrel domain-containing protein n=1 Tax=Evansella tamaricis TaxID=2069301 RepID=A0ABS6JGK6_9BACI|nr:PRC-barrel domain-containing protein [Evansella tamaricis]MBU9712530.1 PRC-barrel domain-containing protein [Evansella tamaricis]